ncbi:Oligopeptide transporter-like protein [Sarcoptes scabiei]|uniref:Oligopeptide transporter-like protein n=1 Tax=Sarcoptes scabiei TaxID=52283 RepID=A0A132A758_SARSC|nr:Oligopeptide transporter-like protein [Sarcoptes scabiei]
MNQSRRDRYRIRNPSFSSSEMNFARGSHSMGCEVRYFNHQMQHNYLSVSLKRFETAILVFYFKFILSFNEDLATQAYHIFAMACYFTPVLGAILADSFIGKFWTILSISCIYAAGNIILSFASISGTSWISFFGLALIALGTGGIKPCVSAFGGDQFLPGQERQLQQFFSLFYISINSGSLISTFLTPILRQDIHCFGRQDCYPLAFGIPAILMVVALILFILGRFITGYIIHPPQKDNIVVTVCCCVALGNYTIKPDQIQVINPLLVILFIPVFDYLIYPFMNTIGLNKPLKRMVIGGLLAALSFGVCGFIQTQIEMEEPVLMLKNQNHLLLYNGLEDPYSFQNETIAPQSLKKFINLDRKMLTEIFDLSPNELKNDQTLIIYYRSKNENPMKMVFENVLVKPEKGGAKIFTLFELKNYDRQPFFVPGKDPLIESIVVGNYSKASVGYLRSFEIDVTGNPIMISVDGQNITYLTLQQGATYFQLIRGDLNKVTKKIKQLVQMNDLIVCEIQALETNIIKIVDENKLSVFLQLIQYIIMTSAEIMFSVTGLEFSYSQAPKSMKSVLQAAWLLMIAFGNLIVAVIADLKIFNEQSYEFYFFGVLMLVDIIIFAIMSYFYVPLENVDDDDGIDSEFYLFGANHC